MSLACADTANRVVQKLNVGHVHSWGEGEVGKHAK